MRRAIDAIAQARESRARNHDLKAAELARDAASRPGTGLSRRPKTPLFLTRDEGVMCVSPVSPSSSPMSPGTFLSNVMKKKLRLKRDKDARKTRLAAQKEKAEREAARNARPWLALLRDHPSGQGTFTAEHLSALCDTVARRLANVMHQKECIECMCVTQLEKVLKALHKLNVAMCGIIESLLTSSGNGTRRGTRHTTPCDAPEGPTSFACKKAILRAQSLFDEFKKALAAFMSLATEERRAGLQGLAKVHVKDTEDGSRELEDVFGFVALFAPVGAIKLHNDLMRSVGEAFLKKLGARGGRIQEGYLEKKVEDLFHELDADGGGDIDFEEMSDGLARMGVNVSKRELKKLLAEFDSDGNLQLDMDEFKGMVKNLLHECKVVIEKDHESASAWRTKRPSTLCVDEDYDGRGGEGSSARTSKQKANEEQATPTPAWSKRRGSLMYSHLKTPDHMLKRRAEVAAKKAARKREISPTFYGLRPKTSL
eukprot:Tamp_08643.p1 GENE.Tamp_08643~~Tamp_08643.p1  ORF type:complete len:509 (+),score=101.54 Tamp_08643:78-1529(+)